VNTIFDVRLRKTEKVNNSVMKKNYILFGVGAAIFVLFAFFIFGVQAGRPVYGYLRIHIRANSDSAADQVVKYVVTDAVSAFMTDLIIDAGSAGVAMRIVDSNLKNIEGVANRTLRENGFRYNARARLAREKFPTRSYSGTVLAGGLYDALIIELGAGRGDNWWCVIYPPLCFGGSRNPDFRSIFRR